MKSSARPLVPMTSRTPAASAASREPRRPLGVREVDGDVRAGLLDDGCGVRAERDGAGAIRQRDESLVGVEIDDACRLEAVFAADGWPALRGPSCRCRSRGRGSSWRNHK